ncbi:MAG: ABC transporter substrate-binding protein, partial [Alphaproteobacteria bacterium]
MPNRFASIARLAVLAAALLGLAAAVPAQAQAPAAEQAAAKAFIDELSQRAFAALRDPELQGDAQRQRFRELLREGVAIDYVGQILLGRFRRDATPEQLAEYKEIFPEYIIRIYTGRLLQIGDEQLEILNALPQGQRDVMVRTQL